MKKQNTTGNQINIIGHGTTIDGGLKSSGSFNINGTVKGTVSCDAQFTLGENGVVEGDVRASDAVIGGKIKGSIRVQGKITLENKAYVVGEIECARLSIEEGAHFEGNSSMGAKKTSVSVEKMKADEKSK
jgi:cytoskeletal protein CcmA (bactofilin family)